MRWETIEPSAIGAAFEAADGDLHVMRSFMASSQDPAAIHDQTGRILYCNRIAQKTWGVTLEQARGRSLSSILDLSRHDDEDRQNKKVLQGRMPMVFFLLGTTGQGKIVSYALFKFPFFCSDLNTLIGMFALPSEFKKPTDL